MKYLALLIILSVSGCACFWSDEMFIMTIAKDYDLKALTSTSNKFTGEATLEMPPKLKVKTE